MLSLFASLTLVVGVPQDDAVAVTNTKVDDAKTELAALTGALAKAESYTFTVQSDGGSFGGGRGGFGGRGGRGGDAGGGQGGDEPPPPPPVTKGTYKKGLPLHLSQGEAVAYKDGDQLVHKNADGEWELLDMEAMRGRGGFGGRGGGERGGRGGGEGGGERGGRGDGEGGADRESMRAMFAVMSLRAVEAPHASLAGFGDKVDSIKKSDKDGTVTYTGDLTEEAATELSRRGRGGFGGRGGRGGGGGGGPQLEYDGTYTIVVTKGAISTITYEVTMSGSFREQEFERTTKSETTFAEVGKAKLEVPDAALAQFEI